MEGDGLEEAARHPLGGIAGVPVGTALVILPGAFRKAANEFLPAVEKERLPGWRMLGIVVTSAGFLLIYVGVFVLYRTYSDVVVVEEFTRLVPVP